MKIDAQILFLIGAKAEFLKDVVLVVARVFQNDGVIIFSHDVFAVNRLNILWMQHPIAVKRAAGVTGTDIIKICESDAGE